MHFVRRMCWLADPSRFVTRPRLFWAFVLTFATLISVSEPAVAQFSQQGPKLVGSGAAGAAQQGNSIALSSDGNTAIVGGNSDNSYAGAAWVFTRIDGVWSQQGDKLIGAGATGAAEQGYSVALSADGNTAIVGGFDDNSGAGAAWVWTRSGGVWVEQGPKLVGSGAVGSAEQGYSVALSSDGNTALVGGYQDNSSAGAAWVYTRSGNVWTQQGSKLVGIGAIGAALQAYSVALSSDGNTAILGGAADNSSAGAAWVYTRSGSTWTQQSKLVGTGVVGAAEQGYSVALSADGNTAIMGGYGDNSAVGAAWVFTRSGGVWSQQGGKLVGAGATGAAEQGNSVALSADGNNAIVGGRQDNSGLGAAWVFTRSGGVWTQYGSKLVGTGAVGDASQGYSVALSADGNTAIVGGIDDNANGAVWVFTQSGGVWTQQGSKLVGTGYVGSFVYQGWSVALSADGSTAVVGGIHDDANGAAWVFVQPPSLADKTNTHDFNGDGISDILSRDTNTGDVKLWLANGGVNFPGGTIANMATNWQIVAQRDFNGDGKADILWRDNTTGTVKLFLMNGLAVTQNLLVASNVASHFVIAGVGDFNGDGKADILWRDSNTGYVSMWFMNGATATAANVGSVPLTYSIIGTSPNDHILWRTNSTGALTDWVMNGAAVSQTHNLGTVPNPWAVVGSGDFDGNGSLDLLLRNGSTGQVLIWFYTNGVFTSSASLGNIAAAYSIDLTGDFNGNGKSDIVWTNTSTGARSIWFMNGGVLASSTNLGTVATTLQIQSKNAE